MTSTTLLRGAVASLICGCLNAVAAPVLLFNTGVDNTGTALALGVSDPHWQIVAFTPGPGIQSNLPTVGDQARTINTSAWEANSIGVPGVDDYRWVGNNNGPPAPNDFRGAGGFYTYQQTFDLSGTLTDTFALNLSVASDDGWRMVVNNVTVANSTDAPVPPGSPFFFRNLTFTAAQFSAAGVVFLSNDQNRIEFVVQNGGTGDSPTGLLVGNILGDAVRVPELNTSAAVLPALLLVLLGFTVTDQRSRQKFHSTRL